MAPVEIGVVKIECSLCRYWDRFRPEPGRLLKGECRRMPPTLHWNTGPTNGSWPTTRHDDWCGEGRADG